jgi:hypothetical protein
MREHSVEAVQVDNARDPARCDIFVAIWKAYGKNEGEARVLFVNGESEQKLRWLNCLPIRQLYDELA